MMRQFLVGLVLFLISLNPAFAALTFPPLSGIVVDQAQILSPKEKSDLENRLLTYERTSGHQLVVAIVPSLQGTDISDYSNQLFRSWGLGDKQRNDGILIVVAPKERQMRIEVGYGLEGDLPDAIASLIISRTITPPFKQGQYASGLNAGIDDIIMAVSGQKQTLVERFQQQSADQPSLGGILLIIFLVIIVWIILSRVSRGRGVMFMPGGFGGGGFGGGGFGGGGFGGGGGSSGGGGASGGW